MGTSSDSGNEIQGLANKYNNVDMDSLVKFMNGIFLSVCNNLLRLQSSHPIFDADEPLPAEFIISVTDTEVALEEAKVNKVSGPETFHHRNIGFSHLLAAPVTAIFNSTPREEVLPKLWKSATVIHLWKKPDTVEIYFIPISRAPILAKVVESFVLQWIDICVNRILMHLPFQNAFDKKAT